VRGGDETPHPLDADDQAALIIVDDSGLEYLPGLETLEQEPPAFLGPGAVERKDDLALLILGGEDIDQDLIADLEGVLRVFLKALRLIAGDDPLGLGAHIDQDSFAVNRDHYAINDIAAVERLVG